MRIVVIGDTHGHQTWKRILNDEEYDKAIMLGDYVDSFTLQPRDIADNLLDIIKHKERMGDKLILLYGNHDHSYYHGERCSGWNRVGHWLYGSLLEDMFKEKMFELIHIDGDIIYSHAGVSDYWMREVAGFDKVEDITFENILSTNAGLDLLDWNMIKGYDGYGDTISQSPIWIRPHSLLKCKVDGYRQVVGHTHLRTPVEQDGIWFNDQMPDYYIVVDDGSIEFKESNLMF